MTDTRRAVLWMVFIVSLLCLWQSWQHFNGHDSLLFGPAPINNMSVGQAPSASSGVPTVPSQGASAASPVASATAIGTVPNQTAATGGQNLQVATDFLTVDINSLGADVNRVELTKYRDQSDTKKNMVLLEKDAARTYVAQTGLAGGENFPNHNTLFTMTPGPAALAPGQDELDVTFTAESGGVKLVKTFVFHRGSYEIGLKQQVTNLSDHPVL